MKIFISHSQQDKDVAIRFKNIFEDFSIYWMPQTIDNVSVFLSSKLSNDQRQSSDQWQENFEKHLRESDVVVILITPKSINSRWVQYETGYAMALGKPIYQIAIRGVTPEKILLYRNYIHIIKTGNDIKELCAHIFRVPDKLTEGWYMVNSNEMGELINLCNERCVYIVGSTPLSESDNSKWKNPDFVNDFLERLTQGLLKKGSRVSSYPTVKEVGEKVYYAAKAINELDLYEISGLYNFDGPLKTSKDDIIEQKTWIDYLSKFREHYLENKDCMIILGGNNHTREECEVAEKLGYIELFPIPCTGGFAAEKYDELSKKWWWTKFNHPCKDCYQEGNYKNCNNCTQIENFVQRLEQYRYRNEDERIS